MRRTEGRETWHRLLEWDKGQAPSERLAALLLANEGFKNVDPSHPLGGRFHTYRSDTVSMDFRASTGELMLFTNFDEAVKIRKSAEVKYFGKHRYDANN